MYSWTEPTIDTLLLYVLYGFLFRIAYFPHDGSILPKLRSQLTSRYSGGGEGRNIMLIDVFFACLVKLI